MLDCGTGTGCLLIAVLSERPHAAGIGIDIDPDAVATARANAARCGQAMRAEFVVADWRDASSVPNGSFDLVLANPPYIPSGAIAGLEPEVARYDPKAALDGGADGLDAYRALAPVLANCLAASGHAVVEIGEGQADEVAAILEGAGLVLADRKCDLAGIPRCLIARPGPKKPFGVGGRPD